jgi:hypothetical protein
MTLLWSTVRLLAIKFGYGMLVLRSDWLVKVRDAEVEIDLVEFGSHFLRNQLRRVGRFHAHLEHDSTCERICTLGKHKYARSHASTSTNARERHLCRRGSDLQ